MTAHHSDAPDTATTSIGRASAILAGAMLTASAGNYLLNLCLARWMTPEEFGDATLVVTLMLAVGAIALALQLMTAQRISVGGPYGVDRVRAEFLGKAWKIGSALAAVAMVAAPFFRSLTSSASAVPFVVLAVGIPMYLSQSVERGALQGQMRFGRLAMTFVVEAIVRLVATLGAVALGFGVVGATVGLAASFAASWLVARPTGGSTARDGLAGVTSGSAAVRRTGRATSILLIAQIVINNGDVVLAKVLFDARDAGVYAVVALVGRGVFFLSWSVVMAAFPVSARTDSRRFVIRAVLTVAALSTVATAAVAVAMPRFAAVLFGDELSVAANLFGPYAVAASLFAVANVIATLELAAGRGRAAVVVLIGACLQTVLLLLAKTPSDMIDIQIALMVLVAGAAVAALLLPSTACGAFGRRTASSAAPQQGALDRVKAKAPQAAS